MGTSISIYAVCSFIIVEIHDLKAAIYQFSCKYRKRSNIFFLITQSCHKKHIKHRWCSQPLLNNGLHSGDLMIAAAVLCSGNNFSKVELMAKILKLHFPSQSSFTRMQRTYIVPAIEEKWDEHLRSFRAELEDKDVVLLGRFVVVVCL